jgi:arginase
VTLSLSHQQKDAYIMFSPSLTPLNRVALIGSASGLGAQIRTTEKGPDFLHHFGLVQSLVESNIHAYWSRVIHTPEQNTRTPKDVLPAIVAHLKEISQQVIEAVTAKEFPVVIGGDHVMAIGTLSGLLKALNLQQDFGLIWVDAHMDSHTPETTPSFAYHGMPLAALLGYGDPRLVDFLFPGPKLKPQHVVLIGIRSFEEEEARLLKKLNVTIYDMAYIKEKGFGVALTEALKIVTSQTRGFGVSIDLDAFDPKEAPGVGTPAPHGLTSAEVLPCLKILREHHQFKILELAEFNPDLDVKNATALLIEQLLKQLLPKSPQ